MAITGHVGDTRMYLKRDEKLYPLTRDHSFVNEMVSRGALSAEEALHHPMANVLTRAVGPQANVAADTNVLDIYEDDLFFLCSDGVSKGVDEPGMLTALGAPTLKAACQVIVDAANAAGGDDNATVVMARVRESTGMHHPYREAVEEKIRTLASLPVFAGLDPSELAAVVSVAGQRSVAKDEVISRAGLKSEQFYVLVRGRVSLRLMGAEVLDINVGKVFGDVEMFVGKPALMEAVAVESSEVLTFARAHLEDLFLRDAPLGVKLLWRFTTALSTKVDEVLRRGTLTE